VRSVSRKPGGVYGATRSSASVSDGLLHPSSVLNFDSDRKNNHGVHHPTQKPLDLMMWLVETYTNEGDLVIDPFLGSGTTALACARTNRRFIGIEKEQKYFDLAIARLRAPQPANLLADEIGDHAKLDFYSVAS
jgi:site-specific DNA-methyltransferase (adenine-specific)